MYLQVACHFLWYRFSFFQERKGAIYFDFKCVEMARNHCCSTFTLVKWPFKTGTYLQFIDCLHFNSYNSVRAWNFIFHKNGRRKGRFTAIQLDRKHTLKMSKINHTKISVYIGIGNRIILDAEEMCLDQEWHKHTKKIEIWQS